MWGNGFPAMRFCTVFPDRCESRAFFVRQPGGGMDCFFLAAFAAFGIFGVAVLVEGGANPARRVRGGFYLFRFCWFLSQASFC